MNTDTPDMNNEPARCLFETNVGVDIATGLDQSTLLKLEALGISPELFTSGKENSFSFAGHQMCALEARLGESLRLRDYPAKYLNILRLTYPLTRTHLGHKKVGSASARKRKAQRQSMVKYSPLRLLTFGTSTGRLNQSEPQMVHRFAKPRTKMGDLFLSMKAGGLFRD